MDPEFEPDRYILAVVQMDVRIGEKRANLDAIEARAREAAALGARLAVFPECALTGYAFDDPAEARSLAEPIPGPSTEAATRIARAIGIWLVFGLLETAGEGFHNTAVLVGPAGLAGSYRKVHLPRIGLDRFAAPGDGPFAVHDTPLGRLGLHICYDAGFPEAARVLALLGADILVLPTSWPAGAEELAEHVPSARAIENHVWYAAADRVGEERGARFIGRSRIVDPLGRTLALGSADREEVIAAEIEPARAREKRVVRVPGKNEVDRIGDRRPGLYGAITEEGWGRGEKNR
jgi:predicted amidohydrolase